MPTLSGLRNLTSTTLTPDTSTPRVGNTTERPLSETPLGPVTHLPRNRVGDRSTTGRTVGTAVLLGLQGVGALVGTASTAHAQPALSPEAFQAKLAELEAKKDTMTPSELATARRALYSSYVASQGTASTTTAAADAYPFEAEWAKAGAGSIDRAKVADAIKLMGTGGTEQKLLSLATTHADRLAPEAKADLEAAAAGRALAADAVEGGLTALELTQVEARLAAKIGDGAAAKAILRAFPAHADALDNEAIEHLLMRAGSVQTHAARLVSIVDEMLAGKNIVVDVNADGQIDKGDVVLTKKDDGKHLIERVAQSLVDETKVAKAMVDASDRVGGAGISFKLMKDHMANPDFWTIGSGGTLELKPGVKPSDAVADITKNGHKYGFECATGLVVVYYEAMLQLLGPKDFDRVAADVRIGPWDMEGDLQRLMVNRSPNPGKGVETELGDHKLVPGRYYYFRNWDVTDEGKARGWQGENVIYLGEGRFYGHGIGFGQGETFVNKLAGEMKEGGRTPSLLNLDAILHTDVLKLDLHPGQ